jgi:hypothetical protein
MSCCGRKREALTMAGAVSHTKAQERTKFVPTPVRPPVAGLMVTVRVRHRGGLMVLGAVTGNRYQFAAGGSMQAVDKRDLEALLGTGAFERVWG